MTASATATVFYRDKAERYRAWARKARTPESAADLETFARRYDEMAAEAEKVAAKTPQPAA